MEPWTADPGSWQDMGDVVDDWMGEPAGGMGELDDNLRALDSHADLASFGGGPYPQMQDVDGDYAADGSRFNATVGDASEAAEPRAPPFGQTSPPRQPRSVPGQPAEPHPASAMWLAPATSPGGFKQVATPHIHRAQSSACAVSPTASGANASPSKPSRPACPSSRRALTPRTVVPLHQRPAAPRLPSPPLGPSSTRAVSGRPGGAHATPRQPERSGENGFRDAGTRDTE